MKELPSLLPEERLNAYNLLIQGCQHLWQKGKLNQDKALDTLKQFYDISQNDPVFLAHFTSWVIKNSQSKDLKVFSTYSNALSIADGLPFSPNSKYRKPNFRIVSASAIQELEPRLVFRVKQLGCLKWGTNGLSYARHWPIVLNTAVKKYIKYREKNPFYIRGIKNKGLSKTYINLYRLMHLAPSPETASILRWKQKTTPVKIEEGLSFDGLTTKEIAEKIIKEKIKVQRALGAIPEVTPEIAIALLYVATPDEVLILSKLFEDKGLWAYKEIKELYEKKISQSRTAVDRVTRVKKISSKLKHTMKKARAKVHKEDFEKAEIGKVFLHIDISGSMEDAIRVAKRVAPLIAEMVSNPEENFRWGVFNVYSKVLPLPDEFVEDAFAQILFGIRPCGATDCFALYPEARKFGADVDIFITELVEGHNMGNLTQKIKNYESKPKACVIIDCWSNHPHSGRGNQLEIAYKDNGVPVSILDYKTVTNSALVMEAIKVAMKGQMAIIEEIMNTPLLTLPEWYYAL